MPQNAPPELRRARDELVLRAHRADDAAGVLAEASTRLRRIVPFDYAVWFVTDPATGLPVAPTRIEGNLEGENPETCSRWWRWEFMDGDVGLLRDIARASVPAAGLRAVVRTEPERSRRYRRMVGRMGLYDELRTVMRVADSPWGGACLYRSPGRPQFNSREISLVASLSAPLGEALRWRSRNTAVDLLRGELSGPGLLLFDPGAQLVSADDRAATWLGELPPGGPMAPNDLGVPVPVWMHALVFRAAAVAHEGNGDGTARARLRTRRGMWLVCHASYLRSTSGRSGQVAVVVEPATSTEILPIVVEAYDLSHREQQIIRLIARGIDTREISTRLHLSTHTVRDYLKTIFRKVGVSSRGELVAKLFAEHFEPLHAADVTRLTLPDE